MESERSQQISNFSMISDELEHFFIRFCPSLVFLPNRAARPLPTLMGLTKQYLRYAPSAVFGVIGSQKANIAYVTLRGGERGRYVAVAACEHVFVWDVRKGEKVGAERVAAATCGGSPV